MAYVLQALIGKEESLRALPFEGVRRSPLSQGYALVPFTSDFRKTNQIPKTPMCDQPSRFHSSEFLDALAKASEGGAFVYVEAQYFGTGIQATIVFKDGKMVGSANIGSGAISRALKEIGVRKGEADFDEFDTLGLGKHRSIEEWPAE